MINYSLCTFFYLPWFTHQKKNRNHKCPRFVILTLPMGRNSVARTQGGIIQPVYQINFFSEVFVWISLVLVFLCSLTMVLLMIILWLIIGVRLGLTGSIYFSPIMLLQSVFVNGVLVCIPSSWFQLHWYLFFFVNDCKCICVAVFLWFSSVNSSSIQWMSVEN